MSWFNKKKALATLELMIVMIITAALCNYLELSPAIGAAMAGCSHVLNRVMDLATP